MKACGCSTSGDLALHGGRKLPWGLQTSMSTNILDNRKVARLLRETAELLEAQGANVFRVQAYRRAAAEIERLRQPVAALALAGGADALDALPGIGAGLARAIAELVTTGQLPILQRLRGRSDPEALLATVPGIGPVLAERIHHELGVGSLEDLELAVHDGRLAQLQGVGSKRLEGIGYALAGRLQRPGPPTGAYRPDQPSIAELLDVDREYRTKARAGRLRTISPRRFNPQHQSWLPVLHTTRGDRHFTALFSNTALAHRLGRTRDWVVVYYDGSFGEGQATVVTQRTGRLRGRRVVRGREAECFRHYGVEPTPPARNTDGDGVI